MKGSTPPEVGDGSPWGVIDFTNEIAEGIIRVDTPGHGGIWLSDNRKSLVPQKFRNYAFQYSGSENWYEEDEAVAAVMVTFPEYWSKDMVEKAHEIAATF